jgi:hypothetical protein
MKTKEIPRDEWSKFFDSFSRNHSGSSVTLEIIGLEIGAQIEEHELVFEGIVSESDKVRGYEIAIMMGAKPEDHITHSISRVAQVSLEQSDQGTDGVLAIKSADGVMALLRFRSATLPEIGDTAKEQPSPPL